MSPNRRSIRMDFLSFFFLFRFQNRRAKWRKREKTIGRESPNFTLTPDIESFRHQMSTYLSNALSAVSSSIERRPQSTHYLPYGVEEKLFATLPFNSSTPLNFFYQNQSNLSRSPSLTSSSSSSSSDSSYLNQTIPTELQDKIF